MSIGSDREVKIVGKGHASCIVGVLQEWREENKNVDVILLCVGQQKGSSGGHDDGDTSDSSRPIQANRSVLAAASPVLARIFAAAENPLADDADLRVILAGYSSAALRCVVDYVYTGTLAFSIEQKRHVQDILNDFRIHSPEELLNTAAFELDASDEERSTGLPTQVVSSAANVPKTLNRKNQPTRRHVDQHRAAAAAAVGSTAAIQRSKWMKIGQKKARVVIDAAPTSNGQDLMVAIAPSLATTCRPSRMEFVEKTGCLKTNLLPTADTRSGSDFYWKKLNRGVVSTFYDVPGVFTLFKDRNPAQLDFPYSCPPVEFVSGAEVDTGHPSLLTSRPSTRTYGRRDRTKNETLLLLSKKNDNAQRLSLGGLSSANIESVCLVGRKVHITTRGAPNLNAQSSFLYDDLPTPSSSQPMGVSRLNLEHNYHSPGETEAAAAIVYDEYANAAELDEDIEYYKRSLQLAINEQRRQNRLKQRLAAVEKDVNVLKERAVRLLSFCRRHKDGHEEGHCLPAVADREPAKKRQKSPSSAASRNYIAILSPYR